MYEQLRDFMREHTISQEEAAKYLGISKSSLNAYLQNKYAGKVSNIDSKVEVYLRQQQERLEMKKLHIHFVETPTAKQMLSGLALAHRMGKIGVVYGGAGTGKTTALKAYQQRNPNCILIEPDTGFTAKVLLKEICRKLGLDERGDMHDLTDRIVDTLRDSGRMLLIDEAEWLPIRALESVRRVHDKSGCAVALVGTHKLLVNLRGPKHEFKQLYSRVFIHTPLGEYISNDDLRCIAQSVLVIDDKAALDKLVSTAKGNVRKLGNLMELLQHLMNANQATIHQIDEDMINLADSMLIH